LPRRRIVHPAPTSCPCCGSTKLSKVGEDVTETLDVVPRQLFVTQHVREKFSCRACEKIAQPPAPFHAIARGFAGPSLLAMILFDKYANHQPLNRQSDRFACEGVELSVSTMADHVGACAANLLPLYELIKAHVFAAERVHGDETTVPVLARLKTRTGRLWTYVRDDRPFGGKAAPAAVFFYSPDRGGEHPERHLAAYKGILQADAYAGFNALYEQPERMPGPIVEAACWAHYLERIFIWSRCGLTGFWQRGHITSEGRSPHNPHRVGDRRRVRGRHCRFRCGRSRPLRRTSPTKNGVMPTCQHALYIHRAAVPFPAMAVMHAQHRKGYA
jgi:transposase